MDRVPEPADIIAIKVYGYAVMDNHKNVRNIFEQLQAGPKGVAQDSAEVLPFGGLFSPSPASAMI